MLTCSVQLLYTVFRVLPLILVRDIYTAAIAFSSSSALKNSVTAKVLMSVLPEIGVIATMAIFGIITRNIGSRRKMRVVEQQSDTSTPEVYQSLEQSDDHGHEMRKNNQATASL
jgi:hypothetical protein